MKNKIKALKELGFVIGNLSEDGIDYFYEKLIIKPEKLKTVIILDKTGQLEFAYKVKYKDVKKEIEKLEKNYDVSIGKYIIAE